MEKSSKIHDVDGIDLIFNYLKIGKFKKPITAGGVMAGSIATIAIIWGLLQSMGFLGHSNTRALQFSLDNYVSSAGSNLPTWGDKSAVIDTGIITGGHKMPVIDQNILNSSVNFANSMVNRMQRIESNLVNAGVEVTPNTPAHNMFVHSYPSDLAMEKGVDALVAISASAQLANANCVRFGNDENKCGRYISTLKLEGTPLSAACSSGQEITCDPEAKYRSLDGTCNNLQNPKWGSALTAYTRLLFPQYVDGIQLPRKDYGAHTLPNPRTISVTLNNQAYKADVSKTLALMQWGQFITNDISYTPVRKMVWTGKPISCCRDDGQMPLPRYVHPDCAAISISDKDPIYGKHRVRCLNYVRSLPVIRSDCTFGPAEQMNQVSHFLDASTIYGSDLSRSTEIRKFQGGLLRINADNDRHFLPMTKPNPKTPCRLKKCYITGDERANSEPHLAVMHTLWHREHNRLAKELASINPSWSDEKLFQEARRIVIAEIQHITYNEWLPILIGKKQAKSAGLLMGSTSYSSYNDPSISNEIATAVMQFLHSLKQGNLRMTDNDRQVNGSIKLSEHYYKPKVIESEDTFDGLVRGLATQTAKKMDLQLISDLSHELYKTTGIVGLDQISLDIQRGRDHGLPGYNDYRKHCSLRVAKSFDDFLDNIPLETVRKLKELYKNPNDVDLIVGGMAERPVDDAVLGPTFRCLLTEQFLRSRQTDRFFYDSEDQPFPFTPNQLKNLKKVTLSRILCDNGDNVTKMQSNAFIKPQLGNELTSCRNFEKIPSIDLFAWAEKSKAYR